eukprot:42647-Eustigmatos_ZCMA.PRE.1
MGLRGSAIQRSLHVIRLSHQANNCAVLQGAPEVAAGWPNVGEAGSLIRMLLTQPPLNEMRRSNDRAKNRLMRLRRSFSFTSPLLP